MKTLTIVKTAGFTNDLCEDRVVITIFQFLVSSFHLQFYKLFARTQHLFFLRAKKVHVDLSIMSSPSYAVDI